MTIDMIQSKAIEFSSTAFACAKNISQIAMNYFGHAVEWLSVNFPVAMTQVSLLAQKVSVAAQPYLASLGNWAIENQSMLTTGGIGVVIGITLASLIFAKSKSAA